MASRAAVFAASIAGLAALASFGLYGHLSNGLPERFASRPDFVDRGEFNLARSLNGYCFHSVAEFRFLEPGEGGLHCKIGEVDAPRHKALLFGDSFAGQWEPFWDVVGRAYATEIHSITTNWCHPSLDDNFPGPRDNPAWEQCQINRQYVTEHAGEYDLIILGGDWSNVESQNMEGGSLALLDHLLETTDADIVVMAAPNAFDRRSVERAVFFADPGLLIPIEAREVRIANLHQLFAFRALFEPRLRFLNRRALFGRDTVLSDDGQPYSLDGMHISIYGSLAAADRFLARDGKALMAGLAY